MTDSVGVRNDESKSTNACSVHISLLSCPRQDFCDIPAMRCPPSQPPLFFSLVRIPAASLEFQMPPGRQAKEQTCPNADSSPHSGLRSGPDSDSDSDPVLVSGYIHTDIMFRARIGS